MLVKPLVRPIVRAIAGNPTASLGSGFSPTSLFADGSKGVVYDNNDLSSFYLDSAGTTAATVNGLVGLQLDKSAGLALGAELSAYASGFSSTAGISVVGATVAISSTSLLVTATSTDGSDRAEIPISGLTVGKHYKVVVTARRGVQGTQQIVRASTALDISDWFVTSTAAMTQTWITTATATSGIIRAYVANLAGAIGDELYVDSISVKELPGNHRYQTTTGSKPVLRGTPIGANLVTNGDFATDTVWTKGTGWSIGSGVATKTAGTASGIDQPYVFTAGRVYRCTYTIAVSAGAFQFSFTNGTTTSGPVRTTSGTYVDYLTAQTGNTSIYLFGTSLFAGTVDNIEIVDVSAGQVTAPYGLQYDGVDDFLQTAAVDFTATDKMFVCAGVRKLSDAALAIFAELSASASANAGAFYISVPNNASGAYGFKSRGSLDNSGGTSVARLGPLTHAITTQFDIAGDAQSIRVNGAADGSAAVDQGTGNFGNYAIYFGRRGGASLPYNGLDFGMVICGKTLTSTQITQTERYIAQRTGVSL